MMSPSAIWGEEPWHCEDCGAGGRDVGAPDIDEVIDNSRAVMEEHL